MKIDKYEKLKNGKYRVYLSTGEVIDTYDDVILNKDLLLKSVISSSDYNDILSLTKIEENYNACVKYITVRLRSIKEIKDYLIRKKVSDEEIEIIIDKLKKNSLLDDNNFTECFIKDKLNFTTMGEYKIINELKKHNISNDIIQKYSYLWDNEVMIPKIEKLVDRQINSNKKLDKYKLRNKIYYYLLNQGYSSDVIIMVLNNKF